jgi:uncharacterized protein (TIGR02145 family)
MTKRISISLLLLSLLLLLIFQISCKKDNGDDIIPVTQSCTIINPSDSVNIQQGVLMVVGVELNGFSENAKVRFMVDSVQLAEISAPPYQFIFDTQGWSLGIHSIRADAHEDLTLAFDLISIIIIDTVIPPQAPVPVINITPDSGNTDSIYSFDASGCYDFEDPFEDLLYRWDFDGDGSWDTEFSNEGIFHHKYSHPGNYEVRLEVMDTDEMIADTIQTLLVIHSSTPNACEGYVSIPYGGQTYLLVAIGNQCWLRENLNIGEMIEGGEAQSNNQLIEKYCYNDDTANCEKYGGLYQWQEIMNYFPLQGTQGICPNGWHIPSDDDWKELEGYADTHYDVGDPIWDENEFRGFDAGKHLKSLLGWTENGNGDNLFDFKARASGFWESGVSFSSETEEGYFWSSTHDSGLNAAVRKLSFDSHQVSRNYHWEEAAFSVRCLRN